MNLSNHLMPALTTQQFFGVCESDTSSGMREILRYITQP